ncbi:hypothetical protein GF323_03570 [Candidatus Woesearchaeota archaeon]|nr:hypothetical protein [Candidatus Woesearchaeota archaeon]
MRKINAILVIMIFLVSMLPAGVGGGSIMEHTATVTLSPDKTNCNVPNTFTVNVKNDGSSTGDIYDVKIQKTQVNIDTLTCGGAPPGWTKIVDDQYFCHYRADNPTGSDTIAPGGNLNFTFDATLKNPTQCNSTFTVSTLDNEGLAGGPNDGEERKTDLILEVDCTDPTIAKSIGKPRLPGQGFDWWITQDSLLSFIAEDTEQQDECNLGIDYCKWRYRVDGGSWSVWNKEQNGDILEWNFNFDEDSEHDIEVQCFDVVGNMVTLTETDKVDTNAPLTTKMYIGPQKPDSIDDQTPYPHWIDGVTTVELSVADNGICAIDNSKTYYRDVMVEDDSVCNDKCDSSYFYGMISSQEPWIEYQAPFKKDEESCHVIEYYSVDELGNIEGHVMNTQTLIHSVTLEVDGTPAPGNLDYGFVVETDDDSNTLHELTVENENMAAITDGQYPFYLVGYKHDLLNYFEAKGWPDNWNAWIKGALNGTNPFFYLDVDSGDLTLIDGFMKDLQSTETYLRINGDYPEGIYIYQGYVEGQLVSVTIIVTRAGSVVPATGPNYQCVFVDKTPPDLIKLVGDPEKSAEGTGVSYMLTTTGNAMSELVSDAGNFDGNIHLQADLITPYPPANEGRIVIPVDSFRLKDIYTIEWEAYVEKGYIPHIDIKLDFNEDGIADDALVVEYDKVQPPHDQLVANMNYARNKWVDTFDEKGTVDDNAMMWLSSGAPGPSGDPGFIHGSLADWKAGMVDSTIDGMTKVHSLEIEVDGWIEESEAYIADIFLNGVYMRDIHWVTQSTNITFECIDAYPHPSGDEKVCYKVSFDDPATPYLTDAYCSQYGGTPNGEWCCVDVYTMNNMYPFSFMEDSIHDLVYYCEDAVEKRTPTYLQYYKVDNTPPSITKTMLGTEDVDYFGDCPPLNPGDQCYVADNGIGGVHVDVADGGAVCAVDQVTCSYKLEWEQTPGNWIVVDSGNFNESGIDILFKNDSTHRLTIDCQDALGNQMTQDVEDFLVDSNPPVTKKKYSMPYKIDTICEANCASQCSDADDPAECKEQCTHAACTWWISTSTDITLDATDNKVGVKKIYYRNQYFPNNPEVCDVSGVYHQNGIAQAVPMSNCDLGIYSQLDDYDDSIAWQEADGAMGQGASVTFQKTQDSCHVIEYMSEDWLGNKETMKWQCVYVDDTAPMGIKDVGDPKVACNPQNGINAVSPAANRIETGDCDWWVRDPTVAPPTPITLDCVDQGNHPVMQETVCYRVSFDDPQTPWLTDQYCTDFGGTMRGNDNDDWCCAYVGDDIPAANDINVVAPQENKYYLHFMEDSLHDLEFYCEDHLGNANQVDLEYFKVDSIPPTTTKTYLGPQYPNPIMSETPYPHYIDTASRIELTAVDGGPVCAVGLDDIFYHVELVEDSYCEAEQDCVPGIVQDDIIGKIDWSEQDNMPYWDDGQKVPIGNTNAEAAKAFNGHRTYEYSIPLSDLGVGLGNTVKLGAYTLDGKHKAHHRIANHYPSSNEPSFPWTDTSEWYAYSLTDDGTPITVDGALGDWSGASKLFTECDATHQTTGGNVPINRCFDMYATVYGDTLYIGIDYTDDTTDDSPNTNTDGAKVLFAVPYWMQYSSPFSIGEESCHRIEFYSVDDLGNPEPVQHQCVFVDKTGPGIIKNYEGPYFADTINNIKVEWINSNTKIKINIIDDGVHKSGIAETKYRVKQVNDEYCWGTMDCTGADASDVGWTIFNNPLYGEFNIGQESCHLIEVYSEDNVGKSATHKQCVFVDNTYPTPEKTVGKPRSKFMWDDFGESFYPVKDKCWSADMSACNGDIDCEITACRADPNCIECWKTTLMTPISLNCIDQGPHPVDNEHVCFQVGLDGTDVTDMYCGEEHYNGIMTNDGFCCVDHEIDPFYFGETTYHNLAYYCEDALGNSNKAILDDEKFKVEKTAFNITINKKWNVISTPVKLLDDSMDQVFADIKDDVVSVWSYDAMADEWDYYIADDNPKNDFLTTMVPGDGYWVFALNDTVLVIGGELMSPAMAPPSKPIKGDAWNLVGYYGADDELGYFGPAGNGDPAECVFFSLSDSMFDIGWTGLETYWEPLNPYMWVSYQKADNLDPGAGYWIFATEDGVYAPTTDCTGLWS